MQIKRQYLIEHVREWIVWSDVIDWVKKNGKWTVEQVIKTALHFEAEVNLKWQLYLVLFAQRRLLK